MLGVTAETVLPGVVFVKLPDDVRVVELLLAAPWIHRVEESNAAVSLILFKGATEAVKGLVLFEVDIASSKVRISEHPDRPFRSIAITDFG